MTGTFFGNFDLAQLALYAFWIFFAGLVIYLQRENQREGYPTVNEDGSDAGATFGMPGPKTFLLPHGRGEVTVPSSSTTERTDLALAPTSASPGFPYEPTGNPMLDGVGPASYALREDAPELDADGHPTMRPLRMAEGFRHFAGKDPRGLPVIAGDGAVVGTISDMWVDTGELIVRYLEIDLGAGGRRLVPMPLARITWRGVVVKSIYAEHFAAVPQTKSDSQVTKLEEEKICAYYAGGKLYASRERLDSQLDPVAT
jgi:photosynthetic reaction center H subunit